MKKLSIVFLALLFVSGTVFALDIDLEGEATTALELDLVGETLGFDQSTSTDFDFTITLGEGSGESSGSGNAYGVIKGSIAAEFADITSDGAYSLDVSSSIDSAELYFGDFIVDILSAPDSFSYAESPLLDGSDDPWDYAAAAFNGAVFGSDGITVTYQDFTVGFNMFADWGNDTYNYMIYGGADLELTPELTVEAAMAMENGTVDVGFTGNYVMDDIDLGFAMDAVDNFGNFDVAVWTDLDLGVPVALYMYYAMNDGGAPSTNGILHTTADFTLEAGGLDELVVGIENILELDAFKEDLTASVDLTIEDISLGVFGGFVMTAQLDEWHAGASAEYDLGNAQVNAKVTYTESAVDTLALEAGISTTNIIDNAKLFLNYENGDLLGNDTTVDHVAKAGVTLSF